MRQFRLGLCAREAAELIVPEVQDLLRVWVEIQELRAEGLGFQGLGIRNQFSLLSPASAA